MYVGTAYFLPREGIIAEFNTHNGYEQYSFGLECLDARHITVCADGETFSWTVSHKEYEYLISQAERDPFLSKIPWHLVDASISFHEAKFHQLFINMLENFPLDSASDNKICNKIFSLFGRYFKETPFSLPKGDERKVPTIQGSAAKQSDQLNKALDAEISRLIPKDRDYTALRKRVAEVPIALPSDAPSQDLVTPLPQWLADVTKLHVFSFLTGMEDPGPVAVDKLLVEDLSLFRKVTYLRALSISYLLFIIIYLLFIIYYLLLITYYLLLITDY